jgi:hypothetical protein
MLFAGTFLRFVRTENPLVNGLEHRESTNESVGSVTLSTWHFASRVAEPHTSTSIQIDAGVWADPATRLLRFDRLVHAAEDQAGPAFLIELRGDERLVSSAQAQLCTRYQRLFARRNRSSMCARFDALLQRHASLHDRSKPLVRADHDHALDVWQWALRLDGQASEALQIAALFHDIERLDSEPDRRIEQHARDYLAFKRGHAARGAHRVAAVLSTLELDEATRERAVLLVAEHEQPADDRELNLLNDADALSFFALNSPGYLAYFGLEQTRKKVAYTLGRMRSSVALDALATVRLEPEIATMIEELRS